MSAAAILSTVAVTAILLAVLGLALFRRSGVKSMSIGAFTRRLFQGWGVQSVGAERLQEMSRRLRGQLLLVDLRPKERFVSQRIPGVLSRPFDDFLKELVVDGRYDGDKQRTIVLVCDTGHMSRVAADIMVKDEGFSKVYNLRGGMRGWLRSSDEPVCWCRRVVARCCL
jgi:rhodanese-related sulfurtransferase